MAFDDAGHDGEAEPRASCLAPTVGLKPREGQLHLLAEALGDAGPVVVHRHVQRLFILG